jgi:hypothetical protein
MGVAAHWLIVFVFTRGDGLGGGSFDGCGIQGTDFVTLCEVDSTHR